MQRPVSFFQRTISTVALAIILLSGFYLWVFKETLQHGAKEIKIERQGSGVAMMAQVLDRERRILEDLKHEVDLNLVSRFFQNQATDLDVETVLSLFERLRKSVDLTHLYFIDVNRKAVFRAHHPERKGDLVNHVVIRRAVETGRIDSSVEVDAMGWIAVRVVVPVRQQGQLLGYLEFGSNLEEIWRPLADHFRWGILVLTSKSLVSEENWRTGYRLEEERMPWETFADHLVVAKLGLEPDFFALPDNPFARGAAVNSTFEFGDGRFELARLANHDLNIPADTGLYFVTDHNQARPVFPIPFGWIVGVALVVTGITIWMVMFSLRSVADQVRQSHRALERSVEDRGRQLKESQNRTLAARKDANIANKAKADFLANMSHELRTPLNAILGFAGLIRQEAYGPLGSSYYKEYSQDILDAGNNLLNVVNDVLDVSRLESGDIELVEQEFDLFDLARSCHSLLDSRGVARGLAIQYDFEDNLPTIFADKLRLKQALVNLVTNAVQHTEPPGHVKISAHLDDDKRIFLQVSDTGKGVAQSELSAILTSFGRANPVYTRASNQEGVGLGLSIVQGICKIHGAIFDFQSQLGEGTSVTIIFPAERTGSNNEKKRTV